MSGRIYFITATDTGAGKTVLTVALARRLVQRGINVAAIKPFCSGSRSDARAIRRSLKGRFTLDEINRWYFRTALAPAIAAKRERREINEAEILDLIRATAADHSVTLVEGAGGLFSPLTNKLDACGIIDAVGAIPIVVCPNRLGAINQALLVVRALPTATVKNVRVVLMSLRRNQPSAHSNTRYLRKLLGNDQVLEFPWINRAIRQGATAPISRLGRLLDDIVK